MSNKRALFKPEQYEEEIQKTKYIINKTKSWKCKQDFTKRLNRLQKEYKEYKILRSK